MVLAEDEGLDRFGSEKDRAMQLHYFELSVPKSMSELACL
jgi:hypothetical protein